MSPSCRSPGDLHLCDRCININAVDSFKLALTTFLFVEPDIPCAVIVCRATHRVVLGRDVLEFLRDELVQCPRIAFAVRVSTFLSRRNLPVFVFGQVLPVTISPKFSGIPSGPEKMPVWYEYL